MKTITMSRVFNILILVLFFSLLIGWSIVFPWVCYNRGQSDPANSSYSQIFFLISISVWIMVGWCIIFRYFILDTNHASFDLGCGWALYLQTDHYKQIGSRINSQLFDDNVNIFERAQDLLDTYYKDNKYEKQEDEPNGHAVSIIEDKTDLIE